MKEGHYMQVSDQIIQVLDAVCKKMGVAIDWTLDWTQSTIIPYVQQLMGKIVAYELWTSIVWILFGVIGWVLFVCSAKHLKKICVNKDSDEVEACVAICLFVVGVIVACFYCDGFSIFQMQLG